MTDERLKEIETRLVAASKGPWKTNSHLEIINPDGEKYWLGEMYGKADADFVAHVKQDTEDLLSAYKEKSAENERLLAENDELNRKLQGFDDKDKVSKCIRVTETETDYIIDNLNYVDDTTRSFETIETSNRNVHSILITKMDGESLESAVAKAVKIIFKGEYE